MLEIRSRGILHIEGSPCPDISADEISVKGASQTRHDD
jgi:hypothetical protein